MKKQILEILQKYIQNEKNVNKALVDIFALAYTEQEIDFIYLAGVFNVSGIDGLQKEINRLKSIGKDPHDIILDNRK